MALRLLVTFAAGFCASLVTAMETLWRRVAHRTMRDGPSNLHQIIRTACRRLPDSKARPQILITGATSGIGAALVRQLLAAEHVDHVTDDALRSVDLLIVTRSAVNFGAMSCFLRDTFNLEERDIKLIHVDLDIGAASWTQFDAVVGQCRDLRTVIHCAGACYSTPAPAGGVDRNTLDQLVDLNVRGTARLLNVLLPILRHPMHGKLQPVWINVGSLSAAHANRYCTPYLAYYGATKSFGMSMSAALAAEQLPAFTKRDVLVAERPILFLSLDPGFVATPMTGLTPSLAVPLADDFAASAMCELAWYPSRTRAPQSSTGWHHHTVLRRAIHWSAAWTKSRVRLDDSMAEATFRH